MGVCMSKDELSQRSRELDRKLQKDFDSSARVIKLLLLGTGESGKSTIVKQMKILHPSGENEKGLGEMERKKQRKTIVDNIFDSIEALLKAQERFEYEIASKKIKDEVLKYISERDESSGSVLDPDIGAKIQELWQDSGIQKTLERRSEFQLLDSAGYFLDNIPRISSPDYIPTEADVLRARTITTGIISVPFQVNRDKFELVDVGGQRSERRKWIHCFDQVTAVLFIIALSEYDQVLYEDDSTNRMLESLDMFKQMLSSPFFLNTPFILFLNKEDIFQEKIKHSSINIAFKEYDYKGPNTAEDAKCYIRKKFLDQNGNTKRDIYTYYTTATDTDLVKNVLVSVQKIICELMLKQTGFR